MSATAPAPSGPAVRDIERSYDLDGQVGFMLRQVQQRHAAIFAAAFGEVRESARDGLVTKADLDLALAGLEGRLNKQFGDFESRLNRQFGDLEVRLTRQLGEVSKDVTGRLWTTVTIIAGVSTAISAVVGAAVALLIRSGAL